MATVLNSVNSACLEVARETIAAVLPDGRVPITEDVVKRTAEQGWVLRIVEARERASLEQAHEEVARQDRLSAFIADATTQSSDARAGWYMCKYAAYTPNLQELSQVLTLAARQPGDLQAQEAACDALVKATAIPPHMDTQKAHAALTALAISEGLPIALAAMRIHISAERFQRRACQALWHITDGVHGAKAAQATDAVGLLASAMMQFTHDKAIQWAACAALANIAKHLDEASVLNTFLVEAIAAVSSAMATFPLEAGLHNFAGAFLWQLATRDPGALAERPGLKGLLEQSVRSHNIREAQCLLDCVRWQTPAEALPHRGAGRRRWGQWASGRRVAV